ncbi:hypothetical protein GMORB2_5786 [Geosmithia morbida]|uniref:Uncharacterized protein n=1 Tax=Geosmithia morbida TaxID=1094350 RepID=A0A9P5D5R9_9HYPO|nr:uncharacterized protein GMORB2_5786 [Geosmithia morbida]KAF4124070.1 hypothetical protein GMORB2_5786 [Geosmithia morbida]
MDTATVGVLSSLLPPETQKYIQAYILDADSPGQLLLRQASGYASSAASTALPLVTPYVDAALSALADNQGAAGLVAALAVVTAVVVVLNWLRRLVMWWTRLVARLAFWAVIALVVAAAWERGLARTTRDVAVASSTLAGYLAGLRDIWVAEYNHYESQRVRGGGPSSSAGRR